MSFHIPLSKKQQEGFLNELEAMKHVKHDEDTNAGTIHVAEHDLKLSYRMVVEVTVNSNPKGIPESQIKQGLEESLNTLAG